MATFETGNANAAGASTRGWFVGDLAEWAARQGASFDASSTPRQSTNVLVKWLSHPPGDERGGWAEPDRFYTLSLIVDGEMELAFRSNGGEPRRVHLAQRGDYVMWYGPEYAHWWRTGAGCTMLTVRWPVADGAG
jgi:hypothetical protein